MLYHPDRHSGTPLRGGAIARNTVRDQWNTHPSQSGELNALLHQDDSAKHES